MGRLRLLELDILLGIRLSGAGGYGKHIHGRQQPVRCT